MRTVAYEWSDVIQEVITLRVTSHNPEMNYNYRPPYACITQCLITHRNKFTSFTLYVLPQSDHLLSLIRTVYTHIGVVMSVHSRCSNMSERCTTKMGAGIATRYGLDGQGFEPRCRQEIFSSQYWSRPALGPKPSPLKWMAGWSGRGVALTNHHP